jgi:hypothetical protein
MKEEERNNKNRLEKERKKQESRVLENVGWSKVLVIVMHSLLKSQVKAALVKKGPEGKRI